MVDKHSSLGDRMKENYESRSQLYLTRRTPIIIRLDGKAFHTLTRGCEKPFDTNINNCMNETARYLCEDIQGVKCAYIQSDEISLLLTDYDTFSTQAWFDYNLQKIVSISSSMASAKFSFLYGKFAIFDSRAFNIPKEEVRNYFIWRQKDWIRNSVLMLSQSHFSHNQLHEKGQSDMHEMLHSKGINWADLSPKWKNGTFIYKFADAWQTDNELIFTESQETFEYWLFGK